MFVVGRGIQSVAGRGKCESEKPAVQQKRKICPLFLKKSEVPKSKRVKQEEKQNVKAKGAVGGPIGHPHG